MAERRAEQQECRHWRGQQPQPQHRDYEHTRAAAPRTDAEPDRAATPRPRFASPPTSAAETAAVLALASLGGLARVSRAGGGAGWARDAGGSGPRASGQELGDQYAAGYSELSGRWELDARERRGQHHHLQHQQRGHSPPSDDDARRHPEPGATRHHGARSDLRLGPPPLRRAEHRHGPELPLRAVLDHEAALHRLLAAATSEPFVPRKDGHMGLDSALRAGGRVLDIGCGAGQWAADVASAFPQADVYGLEGAAVWDLCVDKHADDDAYPNASPVPRNCNLFVAELDTLLVDAGDQHAGPMAFPRASFNAVHLRFMHGKAHDFAALLRRAWGLVAPGGLLLVFDSAFLPARPTPRGQETHAVPPSVGAHARAHHGALSRAGVAPFDPAAVGAVLDALEPADGFEADYDVPVDPAHRAALRLGLARARFYLREFGPYAGREIAALEDAYNAEIDTNGLIVRYTVLGVRKCRVGEEPKHVWGPRVAALADARERQCRQGLQDVRGSRGSIGTLLN